MESLLHDHCALLTRMLARVMLVAALAGLTACGTQSTMREGGDDALMLAGYDPVSYFSTGGARLGSAAYRANFRGVTYRFESAGNRDQFLREPQRYALQYGGYCANGMVYAQKRRADPLVYKVVGERLYLFASPAARAYWELDERRNLQYADRYWADEAGDTESRLQTLYRSVFTVPHYKSDEELAAEFTRRTGQPAPR